MKKFLLTLALASLATAALAHEPRWIRHKPFSARFRGTDTYSDIGNHVSQFQVYPTRSTTAHENCHFISSDIANPVAVREKKEFAALYVGGGRAVLFNQMFFDATKVKDFIPAAFRQSRFRLYLEEQAAHPHKVKRPIFLLDEWNAYVIGGLVCLEDAEAKMQITPNDSVYACFEFTVYALATGMACEKLNPDYFKNEPEFQKFLAWNTKRALTVYRSGQKFTEYRVKDDRYEMFKTGEAGKPFREFLGRIGLDPKEVLGE